MHLLRHIPELSRLKKPYFIALGVFDGLHLGHRAVIRECVQRAHQRNGYAVILTFHPHPAKVLRPEVAPLLLTTEQQDYELFSMLNVDACVVLDFTPELSLCPAGRFLDQLQEEGSKLLGVIVGPGWQFGRGRTGDFQLLKSWAQDHRVEAVEVEPVRVDGELVSSTTIRNHLATGDIPWANARLGRPYQLVGRVVPGQQLGAQIGFPTANLELESELLPACGVYAARALIEDSVFAAAVNIGTRPTVSVTDDITVEAHLLDFRGDLYGHHLRLDFLGRIRDEKKFESLEEMQFQLTVDVEKTRLIAHC